VSPRRIAVLTSGGDAPGMNAAVRAVVRMADNAGIEVVGVKRGFAGLVEGEVRQLDRRAVGGIIDQAGTVLGSARLPSFRDAAVRRQARTTLRDHGAEALVVIGGNGSQAGAAALAAEGVAVVGVASTIDNDLVGSDTTVGFDTAVSVAIEAIDRLRATAASHDRIFLIEVMGRDAGHVALHAAVAGGAEAFAVPEVPIDPAAWLTELAATWRRKRHAIGVVAEGARPGAIALADTLRDARAAHGLAEISVRATVLGHVQRGATPTAADRLLATRLGAAAVELLADGRHGLLVGHDGGNIVATPLGDVVGRVKPLDAALLATAAALDA